MEVMIYDTSKRVALVLHAGEPTSTMIAQTASSLLEKMSFRVKLVRCGEEDDDVGGEDGGAMLKRACHLVQNNSRARKSDCLVIAFMPSLT